MATAAELRVAFIGWNPFQFLHYQPVAELIPGASYIIEERPRAKETHDFSPLRRGTIPLISHTRKQMREIDGKYDVLVCQTPFTAIEAIKSSRVAMLQYGYAKEAHNFAPWRSLADLCLTYGSYASRKIEPYCPCAATGNPRYGGLDPADAKAAALARYGARLDPEKPTLLYAPTWGGLSSFDRYSAAIESMASDYNIILKIHHNSQLAGSEFAAAAKGRFGIVCDAWDDLMQLIALADVVLSDFSGAIFDAIQCRIPVVLLEPPEAEAAHLSTSDRRSLERSRRSELGRVAANPGALRETVRAAIAEPMTVALREELFISGDNSARRAADALARLAIERPPTTQTQEYIRKEMRDYYRCRSELTAARSLPGFLAMLRRLATRRRGNP